MTLRFALFAMFAPIIAVPASAQDAPAPAPRALTMPQASALKCSAAFALGAAMQARGGGARWTPLGQRGREFLVRTSARIMDETGRSRDQVAAELTAAASALARDPAGLDATMGPCLLLLDASGL